MSAPIPGNPAEQVEMMPSVLAADLTTLQRAILLTLAYSDLFDYPLTRDELHRYMTAPHPGEEAFDDALSGLLGPHLARVGDFFTLAGREQIVEVRRQRQQVADELWAVASRYGRWLMRVPFVRMVAVCGSLAAGNSRPDADVDFFLITERRRLWTAQVCTMLLRRLASLLSVRVCPNYLLTVDSLEVEPHDLYHAREVAQAVPLWGESTHRRFQAENRWIEELLPNVSHADDRRDRLMEAQRRRLVRGLEWLLGGRLGDGLEVLLHRVLMAYYAVRLRYLGWRREHFRRSYRDDRQEVMRGGYGPVVERAFRDRAVEYLGETLAAQELERLFPPHRPELEPDRLYSNLFNERYGQGHD